jgi:hypothetical protein
MSVTTRVPLLKIDFPMGIFMFFPGELEAPSGGWTIFEFLGL